SITDANGQAVIAFKVNTLAGTVHTVTASDNTALTGTTGTGITVIAASLDHFAVTNTAGLAIATQTAGSPISVKVTAQDAYNNTQTTFVGTTNITSTSAIQGGSLATGAFTAGVFASQAITLNTAGANQSITATDPVSTKFGTSNLFTIDPGALDHF